MCGIAGLVSPHGTIPDDGLIRVMASKLAHRGPDGDGSIVAPGIGLGHRRLAIIDLSAAGEQPMHSSDGRFTIIYNGEIYNYKALRKELEGQGSRFRSQSDTETILELYRQQGPQCVRRLRGMFAFAIWDNEKQELFFARDRIGKKPFFYRTLQDGSFAFGSEIKAIRNLEPVTIDQRALRLFFGLQYVPTPLTGFQEIKSLPPGHRGFVRGHEVSIERYNFNWDDIEAPSGTDVVTNIRTLLEQATKIRLQADVPVGAFLSGGIDSAAVVAFASKHTTFPIRTFTMGFPNLGMDERAEAKAIAEYFHTDHYEFEATPADLSGLIDRVVAQFDAPYADSSALPVMLLSEQTAKQIKVVLTGDGGDELFGGYKRYAAFEQALMLSKIPGVSAGIGLASRFMNDPKIIRMAETSRAAVRDARRAYGELFTGSYFATRAARDLLKPDFYQSTMDADPVAFIADRMSYGRSPLESAMHFDLTSYLPDDLNVKMDRATSAFGLEARCPFLDQKMVKFALSLPLKDKVNYGKTKVALKRALQGILPPDVLNRKKRGFQVPLAEWFRGPLHDFWKERCLAPEGELATYINVKEAERYFSENEKGKDHGNRLYMLLSLATWLEGMKHT